MSFSAGYGTVLKMGNGADPATAEFTDVAQVTKIGNAVLETMFSTYVQHGGDGFEENAPTTQKIGDIDLELGLDTSLVSHGIAADGLIDAWKNKTKLAYQLVLSDGGALDVKFVAYVAKVDINPDPEKHVLGKVTLKPTGGPTIA